MSDRLDEQLHRSKRMLQLARRSRRVRRLEIYQRMVVFSNISAALKHIDLVKTSLETWAATAQEVIDDE